MSAAVASRRPLPMRASSTVDAAIDPRAGEREAERAGERGLGISGIGRAMTAGIADDGAPRLGRSGTAAERGGANDQQRGEPRRRQVDEIVEPRGGPSERLVARGAVADHAVGGVDRLVGGAAGKPGERHPEHRRDDAVGEILGQALDRRARHAGLVEHLRVAADDLRHRRAAGGEAVALERRRHRGDVLVKAALGDQRAGDERRQHDPERQRQQRAFDDEPRRGDDGNDDRERNDAGDAPRGAALSPCGSARHRGGRSARRSRSPDGRLRPAGDPGTRQGPRSAGREKSA